MTERFEAGAAREIITPPVGTCLYGYRPGYPCESVHDDLTVTAAAFRQGSVTALLVTVTVGDIENELCDSLRQAVCTHTGVPVERILLCATHTHCAPNVAGVEGWGEIDRAYVDAILLPALLKACADAVADLREAEVAVSAVHSDVGINRRQIQKDGSVILGQNPFGCYDPQMTLAAFRDRAGKGILNLIHYGCHGTAAGLVPVVTRDWSGVMIDRVEKETGTLTAFWNGAEGDVGPRLTNGQTVGDMSHVEELGGVAAADAMRAYRALGGYHPCDLQTYCAEIRLPYAPLPTLSEVREKLASMPEPENRINLEKLTYAHYRDLEKLLSGGQTEHPKYFSFSLSALRVGELLFLALPFEIFSEITMRIGAYLPVPYVLCLSNANGYNGYFPSQDQICRGGYEVDSFLMGHVYNLTQDADQKLIDAVCEAFGEG